MNADTRTRSTWFFERNGRRVFDNGGMRRWRCPVCAWWRDWAEERCCGCGLLRDLPAQSPPHSQRKTFAERAVQRAKETARAATSPQCASHDSPFQIP